MTGRPPGRSQTCQPQFSTHRGTSYLAPLARVDWVVAWSSNLCQVCPSFSSPRVGFHRHPSSSIHPEYHDGYVSCRLVPSTSSTPSRNHPPSPMIPLSLRPGVVDILLFTRSSSSPVVLVLFSSSFHPFPSPALITSHSPRWPISP
jgi:hypothetical protein